MLLPNIISSMFAYLQLHKRDGLLTQSTVVQAQKTERKLMCVPLIFVFLRIWGTIRFLLLVAKGLDYNSDGWLLILQVSYDYNFMVSNFS